MTTPDGEHLSLNPETQAVPRPFDALEARIAAYEDRDEPIPGTSGYDRFMTPDEIALLKHHIRDLNIVDRITPELIGSGESWLKNDGPVFGEDNEADKLDTIGAFSLELGYMLGRISYGMPGDEWPDYFAYSATDVALAVQNMYREIEQDPNSRWVTAPQTEEDVIKRPGLTILARQLGQVADHASEIKVDTALSEVSDKYKQAKLRAGFKKAAATLIPIPEESHTDEESSRIAAQNDLAKRHYDRQVARRTPVEYGENYVLNNGDVGVALQFNEEGTEFFNILASKDNPDQYSMSWHGSDNILSDFIRVSSLLVNYRPEATVNGFIIIAGEDDPRDYEDMNIERLQEIIRLNLAQGVTQTAVGFVLKNGNGFVWTSAEDGTSPNGAQLPMIEVELGRDHAPQLVHRLIMRSGHRGIDSHTTASMHAFDRVAHVANF